MLQLSLKNCACAASMAGTVENMQCKTVVAWVLRQCNRAWLEKDRGILQHRGCPMRFLLPTALLALVTVKTIGHNSVRNRDRTPASTPHLHRTAAA